MSSDIEAVVRAADALDPQLPVVIVFASQSYGAILANWIGFAKAAEVHNVLVVALDRSTSALAGRAGIHSCLLPGIGSRAELWAARASLFMALAKAGRDFVHSDADAVWLRSPMAELDATDADLIFSQGTIWPQDVVEAWGFVLCCGFFAMRAKPTTLKFLESFQRRVDLDQDDQAAINRALVGEHLNWDRGGGGQPREAHGTAFCTFEQTLFGTAKNGLRVALLSHRRFPRLPELSKDCIVAHPLGLQSADSSIGVLRRLGLWRFGDGEAGANRPHPSEENSRRRSLATRWRKLF